MLDDLTYIHQRDAGDALGTIGSQWRQLGQRFETGQEPVHGSGIDNIVYIGMGGSALAGQLAGSWPGLDVPFEIVRDYDIPRYVSSRTYCIASSYSGNTEETLSALARAEKCGAKIAVIAGGGQLADIAHQKGYPVALLPPANQPRYAVLYCLKALLTLLSGAGLAPAGVLAELESAASFLQTAADSWAPTVPTKRNAAKQLALECIGKSVVVYAGPKLFPAAYKWKISFNENAKQVAWCNQFSEFNHNEFIGWSKQPVDKPYIIVELRSTFEHERIQQRFALSDRLLSGCWPQPEVVGAQGTSVLQHLLWASMMGDFVTVYTALLNGLDPSPVALVERFKHELAG